MKEIVNRLKENRDLELAKSIMESNGYKVAKKSKKLKEARANTLVLTVSKDSKPIDEDALYDLSLNGIEVLPESDEFPMPWDAEISIAEGNLILSGGIGPGGSGTGTAKVTISLGSVSKYLSMRIMPNDEDAAEELRGIFSEGNWSVSEE